MPGFFNSLSSIFTAGGGSSGSGGSGGSGSLGSPSTTLTASPASPIASYRRYASRRDLEGGRGAAGSSSGGAGASPLASRSGSMVFGEGAGAGAASSSSMAGGSGGAGFSYPPPPNAHGYTTASSANGVDSRRGSKLMNEVGGDPRFFSPNGPLNYYPPVQHSWSRIKTVLREVLPELHDSLSYPADAETIAQLEAEIGMTLPASVRESYLCVDGQDSAADYRDGLFYGLTLLSIEDVLNEWLFWRAVDGEQGADPNVLAMMASIPPGWIKTRYSSRGWIPLIADKCGNYVGVDLDPGEEGGSWGQVIVFGREFDRKCVLWRGEGEGGWGRWLAAFAEELETSDGWEVDGQSRRESSSEGEEDDVGYADYYFDGKSGHAGGTAYGDYAGGGNLRLTGEYRKWNVMEAWWDRSVRRWEELGMGLRPEDLLSPEERRASSASTSGGLQHEGAPAMAPSPSLQGLGFGGMRIAGGADDVQVAIPVLEAPEALVSIPAPTPPTPSPEQAALLQGRSPSLPYSDSTSTEPMTAKSRGKMPESAAVAHRLITPVSPTMPEFSPQHLQPPSASSTTGSLLSPPSSLASTQQQQQKRYSKPNGFVPAPSPLDLPTRADIQAAQAVASAESSGLRGGWVMSMEAAQSAAQSARPRTLEVPRASMGEHEMEDIDLEGGRKERFGSRQGSFSDEPSMRPSNDRKRSSILEAGSRIFGAGSRPTSPALSPGASPRGSQDLHSLSSAMQTVALEPVAAVSPSTTPIPPPTAKRPSMTIVVAATKAHGIGVNGSLPWRLPKEMKYFASVTTGDADQPHQNIVIMGRKTWDGIPAKFRPLKNRRNMVITRKGVELSEKEAATTSTHGSLDDALDTAARDYPHSRIFLIGGSEIYKQGLESGLVDRILITRVIEPAFDECDAFFPDFEQDSQWHRADHAALGNWTGQSVTEGEIEEKDVKYRFEMWTRSTT